MPRGSQSEQDAEAEPREPSSQGSSGLLKAQNQQVFLGLSLGEGALLEEEGAVRQLKAQTTG